MGRNLLRSFSEKTGSLLERITDTQVSDYDVINTDFFKPILQRKNNSAISESGVTASPEFIAYQEAMEGFKLFITSSVAYNFLAKFADTTSSFFKTSTLGILTKHNLLFSTTKDASIDGITELLYTNNSEEYRKYQNGDEIFENTKFQLRISVSIPTFSLGSNNKINAYQIGFKASVINHEVFAHAENLANVIEQWETKMLSFEEFQKKLNLINTNKQVDKEHDDLSGGNIINYEKAYEQILQYLQTQQQKATNEKLRKYYLKQQDGLEAGYDG